MDVIQRAIEKNQHIAKDEKLNLQTWRAFWRSAENKKIFLFGIGNCAEYFLENYGEIPLEGVLDNNVHKQGFLVEDFLGETGNAGCGKLKILSVDSLKKYDPEKIAIIITNLSDYEAMANRLESMDIHNSFVFLIMEANKRKEEGYIEKRNTIIKPEEYAKLCCKEKIVYNKVLFFSFGTYSDHGKYITESLLKIRKDLDIVWVVNHMTEDVPEGVRKVYLYNWKRYIYEMETARVWVYNMPVPSMIVKRPEQIYIQTKHWASVTLKKFYLDAATIQDQKERVENWKYNSQMIDFIITGSNFDTESCRRGFAFDREVLQIGSPRSDAMFHHEKMKKKIYEYYKLDSDYRMLLFAPTYRFRNDLETRTTEIRDIALDYEQVKRALEKKFGGRWYLMLRLPPGYENDGYKIEKPEYVIDASAYSDGEELAAACDVMISDYSSIMFEPAFVKKPVFLFATDQETYINKEYDLLIDYSALPFPLADSNDALEDAIRCFNQAEYETELDNFMRRYGVHEDGHASERAAQFISQQLKSVN